MDRAYVILDTTDGKHSEAVQRLQAVRGVRLVDTLEGPWDVITVIEASTRPRLAELVVRAISSVETIIEDVQLLPSRNGTSTQSTVQPAQKATINQSGSSKQIQTAQC